MNAYVFLFVAQLAVASNVIIGKMLSHELPILAFIAARFFVSSLLFAIAIAVTRETFLGKDHPTGKFRKGDGYLLLAQGLTGGVLFNTLIFEGVKHTTATSAGILASSLPAFMIVFAYLVLKERPTWQKIGAVILTMFGVVVLALKDGTVDSVGDNRYLWGDLLVFLAMIPEALYSIFSRKMRGRVSILWAALFLNVLSFILILPLGLKDMNATYWSALREPRTLGFVILSGGFSFLFFSLWTTGMARVRAGTAAVFGGVLPLATTIMGVLVLGEATSLLGFLGMACILGAIYLGTRGD